MTLGYKEPYIARTTGVQCGRAREFHALWTQSAAVVVTMETPQRIRFADNTNMADHLTTKIFIRFMFHFTVRNRILFTTFAQRTEFTLRHVTLKKKTSALD